MISNKINYYEAKHPFWRCGLKRWWDRWDFAITFFGALIIFSLLASLDEILKGSGLA